jgi:hypothetical protein
VSTDPCPVCGAEASDGAFCGSCGAALSGQRRDGPDRLRLGTYAAAPGERVVGPALVSSLFPHLPRRSRAPFRIGLVVLLVALVGFAMLRWQAPMIATAASGLPVLYVIYLREIDARRNMPWRNVVVALVIGAVLGIGWAYLAGTVFDDGWDTTLGGETDAGPTVGHGLALSIAEALLMLVPALVVRIAGTSARDSLAGFLIGAWGATAFTAAATVTLLAPQLATGPVAQGRELHGLVVEAGIQGVAMPLVSAAVGGIFGLVLWFTPRANGSRRRRGAVTAAAMLVIIVVFLGLGLLDVAPISDRVYLAGYLLIAALALLALRIALQAALLHEAPEAPESTVQDGQLRCAECDHVIARQAFCPSCGATTRTATPASQPVRRITHARVLLTTGAGIGVAALAAVTISMAVTPAAERIVCPPDCGQPPLGTPVEVNPRFSAANGAFSVSYPGPGSAYQATFNPDGVVLNLVAGDRGTLALFGEPAQNRSAQEIAMSVIKEHYPDATVDYEIPNASVGYQPGYGVAADVYPQSSSSRYTRIRVLVMVAVKHDYALVASAVGPYHKFSPSFGSGHPSGANLQLALDMGKYVNSFQWRGDRYGRAG